MKSPTWKPSLICDTSIILYLGRIGKLEILSHLFEPVYITEQVLRELDAGRFLRPDTTDPRGISWIDVVTVSDEDISALPYNRLGDGERSVIAYANSYQVDVVGLDDKEARLFAQDLQLHFVGTVGILVEAKRAGIIDSIRPLLERLRSKGFYLGEDLMQKALQLCGEVKRP